MNFTNEIVSELTSIFPRKRILTDYIDRVFYSRDLSMDPTGLPDAVVLPKTVDEIVKLVKLANKKKIPLYVFGRGSTLLGLKVKDHSIVINLSGMNKILNIDTRNLVVTTETGAVWLAVNSTLWKHGYELPSQWHGGVISSTLGGAVAANAIARTSEPGTLVGDVVLNLEVVLPDGSVINTGSTANPYSIPFQRYTLGPDVTGLFIGSAGCYGIITKVSMRIRKLREKTDYLLYIFKDYRNALSAVEQLLKNELIQFAILIQGALPEDIPLKLHLVIRGDSNSVPMKKKMADIICKSFNGIPDNPLDTKRFWETYYYSWLRGLPTKYYYVRTGIPYYCPGANAYFPITKLAEAYDVFWDYWNSNIDDIKGHGGILKGIDTFISFNGGLIWVDPLFPKLNPDAVEYGFKLRKELFEKFMDIGGCPTAISSALRPIIFSRINKSTYEFMKSLKRAIDPNNILNPGVLFPEEL
ncbi:MAG: FAD-binding oxidoreductase [Candidatus Asgardarchaeia archaeon]